MMINEMDQMDFNEIESNIETRGQRANSKLLSSINTIEPSIQNVKIKKRRKTKYRAHQSRRARTTIPALQPISSQKSMVKEASLTSGLKILSTPELKQKERPDSVSRIEKKCSSPLFSSQESYSVFNRINDFDSSIENTTYTTLNETYLSEYEQRASNSQMSFRSQLDEDWNDLSQHITPRTSRENFQLQQLITQIKHHSQSPFSQVTLDQAFQSPIHSPLHESNFELSQSVLESDNQSSVNDVLNSVNDQLRALSQNFLCQQNHISLQLRNFEHYVREKIENTENYFKTRLTQIEESNLAVMNALNGIIRSEQNVPARIEHVKSKRSVQLPTIPISTDVNLVILNSALKNTEYLEQFVSELSHTVTLYAYNPTKSVKSVMSKLFTLKLLNKYAWSDSTTNNKPTFSSLTNVLTALTRLLSNYMSERDMRQEISQFFVQVPQLYEQ